MQLKVIELMAFLLLCDYSLLSLSEKSHKLSASSCIAAMLLLLSRMRPRRLTMIVTMITSWWGFFFSLTGFNVGRGYVKAFSLLSHTHHHHGLLFEQQHIRSLSLSMSSSTTALFYRNETSSVGASATPSSHTTSWIHHHHHHHRERLKRKLAVAAIEDYDMEQYQSGMTTVAEDLMKQLEPFQPWPRPAHHSQLNARWSFVFTGVPTIGMKLITLLSRICCLVDGSQDEKNTSLLEFDNVFLEVSQQQSQVKAIVRVHLLGQPLELNVYTNLRPATPEEVERVPTSAEGASTLLIESFDRLELQGIEVPTPSSWKSSRPLEITYLDEDMMIARTGVGGEPHLLLRHSPCSTDVETCDLDTEPPTPFFQEALAKYGQDLSRSLVDRAYDSSGSGGPKEREVKTIVELVHGIFHSPNGH